MPPTTTTPKAVTKYVVVDYPHGFPAAAADRVGGPVRGPGAHGDAESGAGQHDNHRTVRQDSGARVAGSGTTARSAKMVL